jgi:hypothetical protein
MTGITAGSPGLVLPRHSLGVGDRFGRQGRAQLAALMQARALGVDLTPVWNKSHREHQIIGTHPDSVRAEADAAVAALGWSGPYFVDADHITRSTVDAFIASSDFFTIDVADFVGRAAPEDEIDAFVARHRRLGDGLRIPGIDPPPSVSSHEIGAIARKYLAAIREAGAIYRHIEAARGRGRFITEISIDETDAPQTPMELLVILAAIADEQVPVQTIAPKFTGRFNKGVDYAGDPAQFEREFIDDLAVVAFAVREFSLPATLKLSVHSGSDKFSIYRPIGRVIHAHDAGLHLKTAGTTWLAEVEGLALAGGGALALAQEIYAQAYARVDELCRPYAAVIGIDRARLPKPETVRAWSGMAYAAALRHDQANPAYNPHVRQLLHVAFKVAAEMGATYLQAVDDCASVIGPLVTENLVERHIRPVFGRP